MKSVLAVSLSPAFQRIMVFRDFHEDEVNRSSRNTLAVSGKGINVSRVLRDLGRPALNLCQLGGCRVEEFLGLCERENLRLRYIPVDAGIRTCTTIINEAKRTSTELVEETQGVDGSASDAFFSLFMEEKDKHDAVIISGTKAPGFSPGLYPSIVREAVKDGKTVVLDIKGDDLKACLQEHPSIIKPNLFEFCQTFMPGNEVLENEDSEGLRPDVERVAASIYREYGSRCVITRGRFDTWVFDGSGLVSVPNRDVPVVNTIGCGDTLTAAMTHSLLDGNSLVSSVAFGMECALRKAMHISQGL